MGEQNIFMENEVRANRYAAKCLVMCSLVCAAAWVLTLLRIFTMPVVIMNTAMPVIILCCFVLLWEFLFFPALCQNMECWCGRCPLC